MKVLIVDNNIMMDSWGAGELVALATRTAGTTVVVRRAPQEDLPAVSVAWDRIILSGSVTDATDQSPWVLKLDDWIRGHLEKGTPMLGVCYGHQAICRAVGGVKTVRRAKQSEFGWARINVLKANPLFEGLPEQFCSYSSHQDEVSELPAGFEVLASSQRCAIQAYRMTGKPVYGIQFHPERTLEAGEASMRKRRAEGKSLLTEVSGKEAYNPKVGQTIFHRFLDSSGGAI